METGNQTDTYRLDIKFAWQEQILAHVNTLVKVAVHILCFYQKATHRSNLDQTQKLKLTNEVK